MQEEQEALASVHLVRAELLYQQGRFEEALREVSRELADDPSSAPAHALAAFALLGLGRAEPAVSAASEAVEAAPEWWVPHHALACALHAAGRLKEALAAADRALDAEPLEPDAHAQRAAILLDSGKRRAGLEAAERGLAVDPTHVRCLNLRASALTSLGRHAEARIGIEAALAVDPDCAESHATRGWAHLHAGESAPAILCFSDALRLDPDDASAREGLIEALKARNPLYGLILHAGLFARRHARWTGAILFAGYGGGALLRQLGSPALAALAVLSFAGVLYLLWVLPLMFDLLLYRDPRARALLSPERRTGARFFGAALLVPALCVIAMAALGARDDAAYCVIAAMLLPLPISAASYTRGWRRALLLGLSALFLAVLAILPALRAAMPESPWPTGLAITVIAICSLCMYALMDYAGPVSP